MPRNPADPDFPHGLIDDKATGYNAGCRCQECRLAQHDVYVASKKKAADKNPPVSAVAAAAQTSDGVGSGVLPSGSAINIDPRETGVIDSSRDGAEPGDAVAQPSQSTHTTPTPSEPAPKPAAPVKPAEAGRTSSLGACRRLQGLIFMGYMPVDIAHQTRLSVDVIWWLLIDPPETIQDVNHRIIRDAFLRMRESAPTAGDPEHRHLDRARHLAAGQGWTSPFSWANIDEDPAPTFQSNIGAGTNLKAAHRVGELEGQLKRARTLIEERTQTGVDAIHALDEERAAHEATRQHLEQTQDELNATVKAKPDAALTTPAADPDAAARILLLEEELADEKAVNVLQLATLRQLNDDNEGLRGILKGLDNLDAPETTAPPEEPATSHEFALAGGQAASLTITINVGSK